MVLVQVLINQTTNGGTAPVGRYYTIPVSGKCSIRVLHVQYHSNDVASTFRVLQFESDALIATYSPMRWITFFNNGQSTTGFDSSHREYHFQNVVLNGNIWLKLVDQSGAALSSQYSCLLTLEIEAINKQFDSTDLEVHASSKTAGSLY
jgi:hypothetical protein